MMMVKLWWKSGGFLANEIEKWTRTKKEKCAWRKSVFIAQVTKTDKEKSSYKPSQQQEEAEIWFHLEFFLIIEIVTKTYEH